MMKANTYLVALVLSMLITTFGCIEDPTPADSTASDVPAVNESNRVAPVTSESEDAQEAPPAPIEEDVQVPEQEQPVASGKVLAELEMMRARVKRNEQGLYVVDVRDNPQFTNASIDIVLKCPNVVDLTMKNVAITDAGLEKLEPLRLYRLILNDSPISGKGLEILSRHPLRRSLFALGLRSTQITDEDVPLLAQFPNLQRLDLSGTAVTDASTEALAAMPLYVLNVTDTQMTADAISQLRQRMPRTDVKY